MNRCAPIDFFCALQNVLFVHIPSMVTLRLRLQNTQWTTVEVASYAELRDAALTVCACTRAESVKFIGPRGRVLLPDGTGPTNRTNLFFSELKSGDQLMCVVSSPTPMEAAAASVPNHESPVLQKNQNPSAMNVCTDAWGRGKPIFQPGFAFTLWARDDRRQQPISVCGPCAHACFDFFSQSGSALRSVDILDDVSSAVMPFVCGCQIIRTTEHRCCFTAEDFAAALATVPNVGGHGGVARESPVIAQRPSSVMIALWSREHELFAGNIQREAQCEMIAREGSPGSENSDISKMTKELKTQIRNFDQYYDDAGVQEEAVKAVPVDVLLQRARENIFRGTADGNLDVADSPFTGGTPSRQPPLTNVGRARAQIHGASSSDASELKIHLPDAFLRELLSWFKHDFMTFITQPPCPTCNSGRTRSSTGRAADDLRTPTPEERQNWAQRVEIYHCESCGAEGIRFPRYNRARRLLTFRKGRCGEFANCFALLCVALGYETRYVYDFTDHVWVETYSRRLGRWVHCDPCEAAFDTPLMYEAGWGKALNYVFAIRREELVNVIGRYSRHPHTLQRLKLRESIMSQLEWGLNAELNRRAIAAVPPPDKMSQSTGAAASTTPSVRFTGCASGEGFLRAAIAELYLDEASRPCYAYTPEYLSNARMRELCELGQPRRIGGHHLQQRQAGGRDWIAARGEDGAVGKIESYGVIGDPAFQVQHTGYFVISLVGESLGGDLTSLSGDLLLGGSDLPLSILSVLTATTRAPPASLWFKRDMRHQWIMVSQKDDADSSSNSKRPRIVLQTSGSRLLISDRALVTCMPSHASCDDSLALTLPLGLAPNAAYNVDSVFHVRYRVGVELESVVAGASKPTTFSFYLKMHPSVVVTLLVDVAGCPGVPSVVTCRGNIQLLGLASTFGGVLCRSSSTSSVTLGDASSSCIPVARGESLDVEWTVKVDRIGRLMSFWDVRASEVSPPSPSSGSSSSSVATTASSSSGSVVALCPPFSFSEMRPPTSGGRNEASEVPGLIVDTKIETGCSLAPDAALPVAATVQLVAAHWLV